MFYENDRVLLFTKKSQVTFKVAGCTVDIEMYM